MEYTGKYHQSILQFLIEQGVFVSIVHAKFIHYFGNNSIRKIANTIKIANYGLTNW